MGANALPKPSLAMTTIENGSEVQSDASSSEHDTSKSDPSVNRDPLPEDSPVFLLAEARKAFESHLPPFVVKKRSQGRRKCVIPTFDGTRPTHPTTIDLIPRVWDKDHVFWTVDVDHKRSIVTAFPGDNGLGGAKWLTWTGLEKGFHGKPLALSQFSSNHPPKASLASSPLNKRPRHAEIRGSSLPSDQENNQPMIMNQISEDIPCLVNNFAPGGNVDNLGTDQTSKKNALSKGKRPTRHSELPARTSHDSTQGSKEPSKRRKLDISAREIRRLQAIVAPPLKQPTRRASGVQIAVRPKASAIVQPPASNSTRLFSNLFEQDPPNLLRQPSQPSTSSHTTSGPLNEPIAGNQDKLNRTTLIIRVAPSTEYTPLKLSECPTMSTFFSKVTSVWDLTEENVARIKIVFQWKCADNPMRAMVMHHNQACFDHMLDEIEDAQSVWSDEKGKCLLDVEIVTKE